MGNFSASIGKRVRYLGGCKWSPDQHKIGEEGEVIFNKEDKKIKIKCFGRVDNDCIDLRCWEFTEKKPSDLEVLIDRIKNESAIINREGKYYFRVPVELINEYDTKAFFFDDSIKELANRYNIEYAFLKELIQLIKVSPTSN